MFITEPKRLKQKDKIKDICSYFFLLKPDDWPEIMRFYYSSVADPKLSNSDGDPVPDPDPSCRVLTVRIQILPDGSFRIRIQPDGSFQIRNLVREIFVFKVLMNIEKSMFV